jgi:hypothetical protein
MQQTPAKPFSLVRPLHALFMDGSDLIVEDIPAGAVVRATGRLIAGELVEVRWGGALFAVIQQELTEHSEGPGPH